MKILKQIFLTMAIVVGLAFAASAQDKDQKQRPPKDPPKIVPGDKPKDKPKEQPKDNEKKDNRGKKPQIVVIRTESAIKIEFT